MSTLVSDAITVEFEGGQPWPDNAVLFQPVEETQVLLPDKAQCLVVKAFLKMCGLPYEVDMRVNAEQMSPSGKVPFVRVGPLLVSEFNPIVSLVNKKGQGLSSELSDIEQSDMHAFISLVESKLTVAEMFMTWSNEEVVHQITEPRYGSPYPWPLDKLLVMKKQNEMLAELSRKTQDKNSMNEILEDSKLCLQALSEKLGEQDYFFGKRMTDLDAVVYGHLQSILTTELPDTSLANYVQSFPNLAAFVQRIHKQFFNSQGSGDS